jgi:phage host-nuclease inhibitor protein Gam
MKRLLILALFAASCHSASAQSPDPPSKMQAADAARLDRDLSHLRELQQAMAPYQHEAADICATYKIDPAQLGKTVGINFQTGEIQRAQPENRSTP